jgi:hypothetical protein
MRVWAGLTGAVVGLAGALWLAIFAEGFWSLVTQLPLVGSIFAYARFWALVTVALAWWGLPLAGVVLVGQWAVHRFTARGSLTS